MVPIRTSYAPHTLRGEGFRDLPATAWEDKEAGAVQYETAWKPTAEELADLLNGGTLYLYTLTPAGQGFPPCYLTTKSQVPTSPEALEEKAREDRRRSPGAAEALEIIAGDMAEYESKMARKPEILQDVRARHFRALVWFLAVLGRKNPAAEAGRDLARLKKYMKKAPIFRG